MKFTRNKKHSSRLNTFYCFSNWRRPNWLQKVSFLYPQIIPEHHLDSRLRLLPLVGGIRFYEAWFCVIIIGLLGEVMTWFNSLTTIAKSKMEMKHFFKRAYSQIPKNNHNHQHRRLIVNACMHVIVENLFERLQDMHKRSSRCSSITEPVSKNIIFMLILISFELAS